MYFWRITKYKSGVNTDEWTSVSDLGKVYDGKVFELKEYLRIENLYLNAIQLIARLNGVSFFEISSLELLRDSDMLPHNIANNSTVNLELALAISQKVLREELWCKLLHRKMIVHFGYDYYMYIGSAQYSSSVLKKFLKWDYLLKKRCPHIFVMKMCGFKCFFNGNNKSCIRKISEKYTSEFSNTLFHSG